ncbi:MAG: hypothetical protein ACRD2A_13455, partial [Vicinamibacterales bacterium]
VFLTLASNAIHWVGDGMTSGSAAWAGGVGSAERTNVTAPTPSSMEGTTMAKTVLVFIVIAQAQ